MLDATASMVPGIVAVIRRPLVRTGDASAGPDVLTRLSSWPVRPFSTATAGASDEAAATSAGPPSLANPAGVGQTKNLGTSFGSSTTARARSRCQLTAGDTGSMA